jgi:AraC-like DNA-binding protein
MTRRTTSVLEKRDVPRGILNPEGRRADLTGLVHLLPSADLAPFVEHYWIVRWDLRGQAPRVQETLPYPSVHMAIEPAQAAIYGVVKGKFTRVIEGDGMVFGIKFRPGGFFPFFKAPVSRLTDRVVPLAHVPDVLRQPSDEAMVAVAEEFLRQQTPERDATAERVGHIVEQIATDRALMTVDAVATRLDLGVRSLQRLFSRYIGVSPKWVINRYRLHEVVERLALGETVDWTRLALDLGYFDQAHFIRDFKSIIGRTPGEYRATVG